jgi:hypothetical protein
MVAACSHHLPTAITIDVLLCAVLHFGGNFTSKCTCLSPCLRKRPLSSPFEGHKLLSLRERMGVEVCMCACVGVSLWIAVCRWQVAPAKLDWPKFMQKTRAELQRFNGVYGNILGNANVETCHVRRPAKALSHDLMCQVSVYHSCHSMNCAELFWIASNPCFSCCCCGGAEKRRHVADAKSLSFPAGEVDNERYEGV